MSYHWFILRFVLNDDDGIIFKKIKIRSNEWKYISEDEKKRLNNVAEDGEFW